MFDRGMMKLDQYDHFSDRYDECCQPDYDYERGQYVHEQGCTRHEGEEG